MAGSKFVAELKRRNVFKVALVYAGIAWLLLQLVSTMMEPLGIPAWAFKFVLLLIAIGFPVALVLAWALELSPEGLRPETARPKSLPTRTTIGHWIQLFIVALLCLLVGNNYLDTLRSGAPGVIEQFVASETLQPLQRDSARPSAEMEQTVPVPGTAPAGSRWTASVAVLPYVNMSAEEDNAIALGIEASTEGLIDWDWQKGEALMRRARANRVEGAFDGSSVDLAMSFLLPTGRVEEARRLLEEKRELDPQNRALDLSYMALLLTQNDWPALLRLLQAFPPTMLKSPSMLATLCRTYFELGDMEQVDARLQQLLATGQSEPQQIAGCEAHSYWLHGDKDAALAAYARREELVRSSGQSASYVLGTQAHSLGETERALDWWELALEQREQRITMVRTAHRNDKALLAHPRFQALLKKMNLDDESLRRMGYL